MLVNGSLPFFALDIRRNSDPCDGYNDFAIRALSQEDSSLWRAFQPVLFAGFFLFDLGVKYYPHHIGDYIRDAGHLSLLEDGAYRRLLDWYYASEMPLPKDVQVIHRKLNARSTAEKNAVVKVLTEFFKDLPLGWTNKRCESEIERFKGKSSKASNAAALRWQSGRTADAVPSHSVGNANHNQEPKPIKTNGGAKAPEGQKPRYWESPTAAFDRAKELGLNTRGESFDSLKKAIREKEAAA